MGVGLAIESRSGEYNGKITWFVVLSSVIAATGGLIFGYDIGVSGGVTSMEPFVKEFFPDVYTKMKEDKKTSNYCKFDSQLLTSFTSSLYIAGLIATFFASPVTRAFGRKPTIIIGGISFLIGGALCGAASNVVMLILGRVMLGVGVGFTNQSVPLYLSEMAPSKYRGAFNFGFQLCVSIGFVSANLINYGSAKIKGGWGWRISLAMAAAPASILTLGAIFLQETPNSLIQRGDHQKAKEILQRVRGTDDVQQELDDLIEVSHISQKVKHPFKAILQRKYRPQLVMTIAIQFFTQLTGINVVSFFAPVLFRTVGLGESASLLSSLVTGVVATCMILVSLFIVDRFGRRFLFNVGGILMLIPEILVGAVMAAKLGDHGGLSEGYGILLLILICVHATGFNLSWGPLGWLVTSEIFPLEVRSAAQSINVACNLFFTFVSTQTFLTMLCHLKYGFFFFFAGWVAVMNMFIYLLLPETKNVPIEKMEKIWREHYFWKRIVGYSNSGENEKDDQIEGKK